jgi:molybdopterin converting factor subunit 1
MRVAVLLFAAAREKAGTDRLEVEVPAGTTIAELWKRLAADFPGLSGVLPACRAAVDEALASPRTALADGAVVAVLPPVSGG